MKIFILKICHFIGLNALFRLIGKGRLRVLLYHNIIKDPLPVGCWNSIPVKEFYWQMKYLARKYQVVKLLDVLPSEMNLSLLKKKRLAVITFDDGLNSVKEMALPILEEFNLSATCFVNPGLSSGKDILWTDILYELILAQPPGILDLSALGQKPIELEAKLEKRGEAIDLIKRYLKAVPNNNKEDFLLNLLKEIPSCRLKKIKEFHLMSKKDIVDLHQKGRILVAPHTFLHPILSRLPKEEQEREIVKSIDELTLWGINTREYFAYPNGSIKDFDDTTICILKEHGIKYAFTTEESHFNPQIHDPFMIPRVPIGADTGRDEFKARLSGVYFFLMRIENKAKRGKLWVKRMLFPGTNTVSAKSKQPKN